MPSISCPDDISSKLNIQVKAVEPVLDAGAQIQQMVNDIGDIFIKGLMNNSQEDTPASEE